MRYRALSASGDYTFGSGSQNFLINSPEAVAQVVQTTLKLWLGEWYLDVNAGTPYPEGVLGKKSQAEADATLIAEISQCQGVVSIANFKSSIDPDTRKYTVIKCVLNTLYGPTQLEIQNANNF